MKMCLTIDRGVLFIPSVRFLKSRVSGINFTNTENKPDELFLGIVDRGRLIFNDGYPNKLMNRKRWQKFYEN
jgi:hypothetical protein